ncbi:hypothetical protein [Nitrospira lenta]|uniref:Uncharacterized protein n=1 Tax=Nitrospira lenta TaxID=1436998 RepID=A0A330L839_9BACT|nr:hypothetical protein [Nitrospira lenta]SPP65146.1 hypothetical protein NITLEN_30060 [Nitrospira lenta]
MGIAVHQIHNLVRTYQRALQPAPPAKALEPVSGQADRVSVSAEARERHEHVTALPEHDRDNPKRSK